MKGLAVMMLIAVFNKANADMYLQNPRGSNNRLDEAKRERNNGNRLFDSQNNNRGGYNVGSLYYYSGSNLQIEWTNQHSCGDQNNHCEIILQYMCGDWIRDGTTTSTIPDNPANCNNYDCNRDTRFGMQENYDYYIDCKLRQRNEGLFTADQNLKGDTARFTRQNPQGTRRGYECPEERDYYPYWHPDPWKDIAVLTNDPSRCEYYQSESFNVKSRYACVVPKAFIRANLNTRNNDAAIPTNQVDCENIVYPEDDPDGERGVWKRFPAHGIAAPICRENHWSRDNHLGNGINGQTNTFNWTVPEIQHERCAMRIRYNISTGEYEGWNDTDARYNAAGNNQASQLNIGERFGLNEQQADDRGYVFENNPEVEIFNDAGGNTDFQLRLAINTAQYGRTFQDRSHTFAIRQPPEDLEGVEIHNVNVRGKRGNIVQVYPATEYDFTPNNLQVEPGAYVHFQWTGSNTNPTNNDGQGLQGTDRSNVVPLTEQVYPEGSDLYYQPYSKFGHFGNNIPMHLDNASFLGFSRTDLENLAVLGNRQFRGEMSELDDAGTYFDLGPRKVTSTGHYQYMCTRNNNFSNRSQKGRIISRDEAIIYKSIGTTGGSVATTHSSIRFDAGDLNQLYDIRLEEWTPEVGEKIVQSYGREVNVGKHYESNFINLGPVGNLTKNGRTFSMQINLNDDSYDVLSVYYSDDDFRTWNEVDAELQNDKVTFEAQKGGVYIVRGNPNIGLIVGCVIAALVFVLLIVGSVMYFRKNPDKWAGIRASCSASAKSVDGRV
ncbi:protein DD3-3-like [Antedon mediterranea]|uniref:protein DD3-3-like n=1 Tax=Antedon mediterranea TaxID=105859 RepID=UPI003AF74E46